MRPRAAAHDRPCHAMPPKPIRALAALALLLGTLPLTAQDLRVVRPPGGGDPHFAFDLRHFDDEQGNQIPDFSSAGYRAHERPIPAAPVRWVVLPGEGDDGPRIQAALDQVATREPDEHGIRGAVLLLAGTYQVEDQLILRHSGVVLRGQGAKETTIEATGHGRRVLLRVLGRADRERVGPAIEIPGFTPVGAHRVRLAEELALQAGDRVVVTRPSTEAWIAAAGMERTWNAPKAPTAWRPGELDLFWDRGVVRRDGAELELDAPLTMALDPAWGGGTVQTYRWPGRIQDTGIENLRLVSLSDPDRPHDEDHSWVGVSIENARDIWVRQVDFHGFSGSAVSVWENASRVTVSDCRSLEPVSELGGWRRHTFFTQGQQTLFLRCLSERGRRDFATGHTAAGPNAFVHCDAREAQGDSGPLGPWATGVLFDNVNIDGGGLRLGYRGSQLKFAGWTAANCLLWQCTAAEIDCYLPPTARNWAMGCWSIFEGDGIWYQFNQFVSPKSLMQAQLAARLGEAPAAAIGPGIVHPPGSTRPSVEQAREMAARSNQPAPQLDELIARVRRETVLPVDPRDAPVFEDSMLPPAEPPALVARLENRNGWLTIDGKLAVGGGSDGGPWWRGTIAPTRVAQGRDGADRPAVTRFVPGRSGTGYTDELDELAATLAERGVLRLEHHPPLWYDRRRDDHERVRRIDAEVWPPFYEMPYARSGRGTAWDGLSQYDLTRPNRWYFDRLDQLAGEFERRGMILSVMHYMQHNILEAGAHWADYPWRSANNINTTDFPEPPPYAGDKRIFQAHLFYDVEHPQRAELHRRTVGMFLGELRHRPNVIHLLGEEYTGPGAFTEHWLRCAGEWEQENECEVLIGLATTKPEQDAILANPELSRHVDLIDSRYWGLRAGIHLAPRQQGRGPRGGDDELEQVRDYRIRYPDKAFVHPASTDTGWRHVIQGGSLPRQLEGADDELLAAIPRMQASRLVAEPAGCLAEPGHQYLVHAPGGEAVDIDLRADEGSYEVHWILPQRGTAEPQTIHGGGIVRIELPRDGDSLFHLRRSVKD